VTTPYLSHEAEIVEIARRLSDMPGALLADGIDRWPANTLLGAALRRERMRRKLFGSKECEASK